MRGLESDHLLAIWAIPTLIGSALFLTWMFRATANAFRLAGPQSITPWGAVYWNFVPIAFFWKPYEAMRNLYDVFIGNKEYGALYVWWALWLAGFALPLLSFAIYGDVTIDTTTDLGAYVFWKYVGHATAGISFSCAALLVKEITKAEAAKMGAA